MASMFDHIRASYDAVAAEYADRFSNELDHKPSDRALLLRFAAEVHGRGRVFDLGCGPGHVAAFLRGLGVSVGGLDLSEALLDEARRRHPEIEFVQGDMVASPFADASLAGAVCFYGIVHFTMDELRAAFAEVHRVLQPGGRLLSAFHVGDGVLHVDEFLGRTASLDFRFFQAAQVAEELVHAGFAGVEIVERDPYPDVEYPSRRAYVFATKR